MSTSSLTPAKKDLVESIARKEGYTDYEIEVKTGSMKGDGYLGIINTIQIVDNAQDKAPLNLIIKSALTSEKVREVAPVRKAYEREIYMYSKIFEEVSAFQQEKKITIPFKETVKCYGHLIDENEESLVLENLKEANYRMWDRQKPMNHDHVQLVFQTYGKWHGATLALKYCKPNLFESFKPNLKNIFDSDKKEDKQKFMETCKMMFNNGFLAVKGDPVGTAGLARFAEESQEFFERVLKLENKFSCILHGDCWCNNMMFKYENASDPNRPTDMRLIDFQISHVGSPIVDLSYFLYACASQEVLQMLDDYLAVYLENLTRILRESGLNPNDIITMDELKEQWKIYSKYGLFMTFFVMKVILSSSEEAPDLTALADSGKNILEMISDAGASNMEAVNKRIANVIHFMIEQGFL